MNDSNIELLEGLLIKYKAVGGDLNVNSMGDRKGMLGSLYRTMVEDDPTDNDVPYPYAPNSLLADALNNHQTKTAELLVKYGAELDTALGVILHQHYTGW